MIEIYYFTGCCGNVTSFGITSGSTSNWNDFDATPGNVYGLVIDSFIVSFIKLNIFSDLFFDDTLDCSSELSEELSES